MNRPSIRHHILIAVIIVLGLAADQAVKYISIQYLKPIGSYPVIDGVFQLTYCENTGASFSMLRGQTWFLSVFTAIVISGLIFLIFSGRVRYGTAYYSLAVIVTGGAGNLIDRIFRGYVVDMFDFCLINFAVFNVADMYITCGAAVFIVYYIIKKGEVFLWSSSQPSRTKD